MPFKVWLETQIVRFKRRRDTAEGAGAERRAREQMLAAMCHELRTPLHSLIAALDMLQDEHVSERGARQLAAAEASAQMILKLADDVLDVARISAGGQFRLQFGPFELQSLLRETVGQYEAKASRKNLHLRLSINGRYPPSFLGDRERVKQILSNILANAINFTQTGQVVVESTYDGEVVEIAVHDSGPGIPPHKQEAIFLPFVQARPYSPGTGLGLPISRDLCEAMGGRLELARSDNDGSTFRIVLPLSPSGKTVEAERAQPTFVNASGHVLVVDDEPINQSVVKAMLDSMGCVCTVASGGEEALRLIELVDFDLILMDCRMPGLDGFETCRRARERMNKRVPIIAMTAGVGVDERELGRTAGMDDYLAKPFDRTELHRVLCGWLGHHEEEAPARRATGSTPSVDEDVFEELWENVNRNFEPMRVMLRNFRELVEQCLAAFASDDKGKISLDDAEIRRNLHTIIGTGGMIGAMEVCSVASRVKDAVRGRDFERAADLAKVLAAASERFERDASVLLERWGRER